MSICGRCNLELYEELKAFDSPIPAYLFATNEPPSPAEYTQLKEMLNQTQRHLSELEQTITCVESTLNALMRRKRLVEYSIMVNKGALSPIRLVPREILAQIFLQTFPAEPKTTLQTKYGLWPFVNVARIWRETALSLHSAWTNIDVAYTRTTANDAKAWKASKTLLKAFQNCAGRPVSMTVQLFVNDHNSRALLDVAVEFSSLWRDVSLFLPSELTPSLARIQRLPALESIFLGTPSNLSEPLTTHPLVDFTPLLFAAPVLSSVGFRGMKRLDSVDLPWYQLTRFQLERCVLPRDVLLILESLPNLSSLTVAETSLDTDVGLPDVRLEQLQSLTLYLRDHSTILLQHLTCPALKKIHIALMLDLDRLVQLIVRSRCSIETISFGAFPDSSPDLPNFLPLLELTSYLTTLDIGASGFAQRILSIVDAGHLRQLEELSIASSSLRSPESNSNVRALVDRLVGRWNHPLRSLVVALVDPMRSCTLPEVRKLVEDYKDRVSLAQVNYIPWRRY